MKKLFSVLAPLILLASSAFSQKEFFRSQQVFTEGQLDKFYSSITIHDSTILFNANDYHLYGYNKNTGNLKWKYYTNYKTDIPVFVHEAIVYAGIAEDEIKNTVSLSLSEGKLLKKFSFNPFLTKPFVKNAVLYTTAIYQFGNILAYDLSKDTMLWHRFIAHGTSRRPYYFENYIMANAEENNWVSLGYDGSLQDTRCKGKANIYVEGIPCITQFAAMSHDGLQIPKILANDIVRMQFGEEPEMLTTKNFTFLLRDDKLTILSNKLRITRQLRVSFLLPDVPDDGYTRLLKADDENLWLLYADHLLQYNHKTKLLVKLTDLTAWQPQQLLFDDENIWLISAKDGLLYGLSL